MMKCAGCGNAIPSGEAREHAGRTLCEDCYLDAVATPRACDPWAVYSAGKMASGGHTLTADQQGIYDLLKTRGPLSLAQICGELGMTEETFRSNFATLRHMELAKAGKVEGEVRYCLFRDQPD